jgi:hypothetical protein
VVIEPGAHTQLPALLREDFQEQDAFVIADENTFQVADSKSATLYAMQIWVLAACDSMATQAQKD